MLGRRVFAWGGGDGGGGRATAISWRCGENQLWDE